MSGTVDLGIEYLGRDMRAAIWDLFENPEVGDPEGVREIFEALLADIAVDWGWHQNCDGQWWRPVEGWMLADGGMRRKAKA